MTNVEASVGDLTEEDMGSVAGGAGEESSSESAVEQEPASSKDEEESLTTSTPMSVQVSPSSYLVSTAALCVCTLTHSYLLISVFPYSGFMVIQLLPNVVDHENAGAYAGLLASSYMFGRAISAYTWGKLADTYGRTMVLYASLALSCIFSLLFGLAQSFAAAMVFRALLGMSNGIIGTAKTAVSELANGNEKLETKGMALVMGMWGWGFLISPALSGALAEPIQQYPDALWVQRMHGVLTKFPFILPNIVGAAFCIVSLLGVSLCVQETLPREKLRNPSFLFSDCVQCLARQCGFAMTQDDATQYEVLPTTNIEMASINAPLACEEEKKHEPGNDPFEEGRRGTNDIQKIRLQHMESCLMLSTTAHPPLSLNDAEEKRQTNMTVYNDATMASLWARPNTRKHLVMYCLVSFVHVTVDEAFPLFCLSREAGLGLSEAQIGTILSGSGAIFAVCQYFVYNFILNRFGLYGSIKIGSLSIAPLVALIPLSLLFSNDDGTLSWGVFFYLSALMAVIRMLGLAFYSSIAVASNRTVPTTHRGTYNGLSMLGGSLAKGAGPVFAGCLVAFCVSSGLFAPRIGAVVIFVAISSLSCIITIPVAANLEPRADDGYEIIDTQDK